MIFIVIGVNILISRFIRQQNLLFEVNENPVGFWFAGYYSAVGFVFLITLIVYYLNLISKSFIGVALVLTGVYANFIEKLLWGNVIDYLSIVNLHYNLADLEILLGLIFLNYRIWAKKPWLSISKEIDIVN